MDHSRPRRGTNVCSFPPLTQSAASRMGHPETKDGAPGRAEASGGAFTLSGGPFGLDLNLSFAAGRVMAEAGPGPVFRFLDESPSDWVAVHIFQLFYCLYPVPHVEVIVPALPEMGLAGFLQLLRCLLLQNLQYGCQRLNAWLAYEQMNVFGHEDVSGDYELEALARPFKFALKDAVAFASA